MIAATGLLLSFNALDDDTIVKGTKFHHLPPIQLHIFDVMTAGGNVCPW
jgi:hypothetical protein